MPKISPAKLVASDKRPLLWNVQILRFVAAAMVLVDHLELAVQRSRIPGLHAVHDPTHIPWRAGVDLFFVVSGFIMYHLTIHSFAQRGYALEFLRRRIIRVVPLYWIFTTLMIVAILTTGHVNRSGLDAGHILGSYLFIPVSDPAGTPLPVLAPGWTLNYEMFFYVCFAGALLFSRRLGLAMLLALFLCLAALGFCADDSRSFIGVWTNPIIFEFMFGLVLGHLMHKGLRLAVSARLLLGAVGVALLVAGNALGFTSFRERWIFCGLPALIVSAAFVLGAQPRPTPLVRLLRLAGDSSYALYLSHLFTINALAIVWSKLRLGHPWVFIVCGFSSALIVGVVVYRHVEQPLLARLRSRFELPISTSGNAGAALSCRTDDN